MPSIQALVRRKLKKSSSHRKSMPKRTKTIVLRPSMRRPFHRTSPKGGSRGRGILGGLGGIRKYLDPAAAALGYGTIAVAAYSKLQPNGSMQTAQMAGLAGEYIGGGFTGLIMAEIIKSVAGVPSLLSGLGLGGRSADTSMQIAPAGGSPFL